MLEEMTPELFEEWFAFYTLEPFGQSWLQAGTVAAEVNRGFTAIISALSGEKVDRWNVPRDYVPQIVKTGTKPTTKRIRVDTGGIERLAGQLDRMAKAAAEKK